MSEIVIDTCVIQHANDPRQGQVGQEALRFFQRVLESDAVWCLDVGFDLNEPRNRSRIFSEYLNYTTPGHYGREVFSTMAANKRTRVYGRPAHAKCVAINSAVSDKSDRVFVQVACQSDDGLLVSHDGIFDEHCQKTLRTTVGVRVVDASIARDLI